MDFMLESYVGFMVEKLEKAYKILSPPYKGGTNFRISM